MRISDWSSDVCSSDLIRLSRPSASAELAPCGADRQYPFEQLGKPLGAVRRHGVVELAAHTAIDARQRRRDVAALVAVEIDVEADQDRARAVRGFGRRNALPLPPHPGEDADRSEERRGWEAGVSTCRSRWVQEH